MQEKYMVNDILAQTNSSLKTYASVITESATPEFRKTIQDIRNSCEAFQYDLFKVAQSKGYYQPAEMADSAEIHKVWSTLSSPNSK
jgi:spore coat protein CotF